jgi:hypothetical protein
MLPAFSHKRKHRAESGPMRSSNLCLSSDHESMLLSGRSSLHRRDRDFVYEYLVSNVAYQPFECLVSLVSAHILSEWGELGESVSRTYTESITDHMLDLFGSTHCSWSTAISIIQRRETYRTWLLGHWGLITMLRASFRGIARYVHRIT